MSMIFLFFADDCRIGKKRKSEEESVKKQGKDDGESRSIHVQ